MKTEIINSSEIETIHDCVLTYGHFSTIHPGHIRYLKYAKKKAKKLIIALIGDSNSQNSFRYSQKERAHSLELMNLADYVVLMDGNNLSMVIKKLKPNFLILGQEFHNSNDLEIQSSIKAMKAIGGLIEFHAGIANYSSSELLSFSEKDLISQRLDQFNKICTKLNLDLNSFYRNIDSWKSTKLVVVGDTILDQYTLCDPIGMSAEAPVIVIKEIESRNFIGGAAIVAAHIKSLGAQCELISVTGDDLESFAVKKELKNKQIKCSIISDKSRPTTFKKRYLVDNQKLLRVSRLEDKHLKAEVEEKLIKKINKAALEADAIIISDFIYGVLTKKVIETIYDCVREKNLMLFADLQCSSQIGNITKYKNASLLCPNEREARLALQNKEIGLEQLSTDLIKLTKSERLLMKLGPEGFIAYDHDKNKLISQPFPALTVNPIDVAGAGDSLLALMATGLASKQNMFETAAAACCMSSLAVQNMGNVPISSTSLKNYLSEILYK